MTETHTLRWCDGEGGGWLELLDQTLLPLQVCTIACRHVETVCEAIQMLRVRGAPAIGVAAAYGVVVSALCARDLPATAFRAAIERDVERLAATRPTAVNLFWALQHMRHTLDGATGENAAICDQLLATAHRVREDDQDLCRRMGVHGAALIEDGATVLTHCNAGALATAGSGTALGVIYAAVETGKSLHVYADETRPLLQGARLTAWELSQAGIDVTVLCDGAAASLFAAGQIDCVIVGSDRIAANGDVANKIGTLGVAVMAQEFDVPFYVAAPTSTVDLDLASGDLIPIEQRQATEVSEGFGRRTVPEGVKIYNPAFDVTPQRLVSAIITEHGVARPPFEPTLREWGVAIPAAR
ncbi:MAG: S-methyl-5-thioribose-1-phosphate isomerase [Gemmatimonadetes bacterium]|jgi:methylthioribose-1-phosphate isomerase|nr:S-methyl-5-thioribose-1-phosphate isomerase [Gemmatimonadota bacterium]MBT6146879.1 S-methyl-5-thioribose-1-phosphate isomerase [Gemmatimonadota bacterium]MBT7863874.1 S-methyl-5-thioribose-1-phosphate isomerase [Gemmatimonadota bacterium]